MNELAEKRKGDGECKNQTRGRDGGGGGAAGVEAQECKVHLLLRRQV